MTTIISIHSPRMGRDPRHGRSKEHRADFNPLSPHGERQDVLRAATAQPAFQSTLPAWGETSGGGHVAVGEGISIHSPRMGRDQMMKVGLPCCLHFNPLSPHGERHNASNQTINALISIHSPRMGRD